MEKDLDQVVPAAAGAGAASGQAQLPNGNEEQEQLIDDDFAMDGEEGDSPAATASNWSDSFATAAGLPSPGEPSVMMLCCLCRKNPPAKRSTYCNTPCAADVKAAERDALRRSQGIMVATNSKKGEKIEFAANSEIMVFRKLKKSGGTQFREAIMVYKSRCVGHGRGHARPSFDWVRYQMMIEYASRMQSGTKSVWMTKKAFASYMKRIDEMDSNTAELEFEKRWHSKDYQTETVNGVQRLLMPIEEFVITMNEKSQVEQTLFGTKDKKNPDDGDIQELEDVMDTYHHKFDSAFYKPIAPLERGCLSAGSNLLSTSSATPTPSGSSTKAAASANDSKATRQRRSVGQKHLMLRVSGRASSRS